MARQRPRPPSSPSSVVRSAPSGSGGASSSSTPSRPLARSQRREERRGEQDSSSLKGLWLHGRHPIEAALLNPERRVHRLVGTRDAIGSLMEAVSDALRREGRRLPQPEIVERAEIDSALPPGSVHQGLLLQVDPLPTVSLEEIIARAEGTAHAVILVLDQVTDPHNVGAILRSAAAFGALAVMAHDRHCPEESGTLAKSSSGAIERMPLVRVPNLARALEHLKEAGFWVAGMAADAPVSLAKAGLSGKTALCLGSEGEGLRRLVREQCDHLVKLPMTGAVESLNVSNAAAVALYELTRSVFEENPNRGA